MQIRLTHKLLPKLVGQPDGTPVKVLMPGEVVDLPESDALKLIALGHAVPADAEQLRLPEKGE